MTKFRKLIPVLVCSFMIAGGSVAVVHGINESLAKEAQAATDCGNVAFSFGNGSTGNGVYLTAAENNLPFATNWSLAYYPVNSQGGVFFNETDIGSVILKKYSATEYYLALSDVGHALTSSDRDVLLTVTGDWYCTHEGETYTFSVSPDFQKTWSGLGWVDYYDIEEYDVVSLLDAGISEVSNAGINTEAGYSYDNLYHNSFPITNNTGSYAFRFGFEALGTMTSTLTIRIGSNTSWTGGHYMMLNLDNTWGPKGVMVMYEFLGDTQLHHSGDAEVDLTAGAAHEIEFGIARIKNSTDYNAFMRYDGFLVKSLRWTLDSTAMSTRVGMYTDSSVNITNAKDQVIGEERLHAGDMHNQQGVYLNSATALADFTSWEEQGLPYLASNITLNDVPKGNAAVNYFKKVDAKVFYLGFTDIGINPDAGDVMIIEGSFKFVHLVSGTVAGGDAVYKTIRVSFAPSAFRYDGQAWKDFDLPLLKNSSASELEEGNLLLNLGRMKPDHSGSAVKEFDQKITWDAENQQEVDTLVYKKDENGHTGIYFTNSNQNTHGEFRVYLPDNGYKTESKGYALTQLTFDYILLDSGVTSAQARNHGLDENGYFTPAPGNVTSKFLVQAMCKYSDPDNMYFDIEVELQNDGLLHSCTVNVPYADICGFCFVLWNFDGTFFMSNCHADFLAYDQGLNNFVTQSLKMYSYTSGDQCASYYAGAKAAYEALSAEEKGIFNTEAAYASARARLSAWALANGEVFDPISGTFTANSHGLLAKSVNNNVVIISIVIGAIAMISLAGVMLAIRRRRLHK